MAMKVFKTTLSLLFALLFATIGSSDTSATRDASVQFDQSVPENTENRRLQSSWGGWGSISPVCVKEGDIYVTRYMRSASWWFAIATGLWQGSFGACQDLCPCGEFGVCTALSPEYQCECDDGYVFDGVSCVMDDMGDDAGDDGDDPDIPTFCDSYYYRCPSGYVCTDNPETSCTIAGGCWGICALSCGGFRPEPVVCPDGTECVDDPADGCAPPFIADCPGVCLPKNDDREFCGGFGGFPCPTGKVCVDDPDDGCDPFNGGVDCGGVCEDLPSPCVLTTQSTGPFPPTVTDNCPVGYACIDDPDGTCTIDEGCGVCVLQCGGLRPVHASTCGNDEVCVDNPNTCSQAVDCPGVCVPKVTAFCGGIAGIQCPEGRVCVDDPDDSCDPNNGGADCGGICVLLPSSCFQTEECPLGYVCTDNVDIGCTLAEGCPGMCAKSCGGFTPFPVFCPDDTVCVDDPADGCDQILIPDCPGVCLPKEDKVFCGGIAGLVCPSGMVCVDDPDDGCDVFKGGSDCGGICEMLPSQCTQTSQCPDGFACTDDLSSGCTISEGCPGICARSCGVSFLAPDQFPCEVGTVCVDDPADGCDPPLAADCPGVCLPEDDKEPCGGDAGLPCPTGQVCVSDDNCNPLYYPGCDGFCEDLPPACTASSSCPTGYVCTDDPDSPCGLSEGCNGICAYECGGFRPDPPRCSETEECVDNPNTCSQAVDCPGICLPKTDNNLFCGGLLGNSCPSQFRCADDPTDNCQINDAVDCGGICVPECGGIAGIQCPQGLFCNDDPFDECDPVLGWVNCVGVCQSVKDPLLPCGGSGLSTCPSGFTCDCDLTADPTCPGTCRRDDPDPDPILPDLCDDYYYRCPAGYACVDNPTDCTRWDGCWGICAKECGGFVVDPVSCPADQQCVDNPYTCSQAVDCKGVCV